MKQQFVALVEIENQIEWLRTALRDHGDVVACDRPEVDRLAQLVDSASANVVFVRFAAFDSAPRARLVQQLLERKPRLAVVALGENTDPKLVLQAVRAGARDFVEIGSSTADLVEAVDRSLSRSSPDGGAASGGRMYALINARPDGSSAALATHLALAVQKAAGSSQRVLLVDLGAPVGDPLLYLDLRATYSFTDAVRSVRRFDESLIHAAFSRHRSGLSVLPLPEDPTELESIEIPDAVALMSVLNAHFDHVVLNLSGFFDLMRIVPVLSQATRMLLLADQCLASCRANHRLLERLRRERVDLSRCELIVDRHTPHVEPRPEEIAELLGISLLRTVPSSGVLILKSMNAGQSVFDVGPTSRYASANLDIAQALVHGSTTRKGRLTRWWSRLGIGR